MRWRCESRILVANSYTGELRPVDAYAVQITQKYHRRKLDDTLRPMWEKKYWSPRMQTIYDLSMSGF